MHVASGGGSHLEQGGGAIQIIKTHLYGEKLLFYGKTVKLGGASAPPFRRLCMWQFVLMCSGPWLAI